MLKENYEKVLQSLRPGVRLVAVSKYKTVGDIRNVYDLGQRIFGENKAQEMKAKHPELPSDIEWHFIANGLFRACCSSISLRKKPSSAFCARRRSGCLIQRILPI